MKYLKMKKKKHTFTLIEVLIAIVLTTTACFFLLEFEESYIKNTRESLKKVQKERLIQEAYVLLLERLYTNEIPWKVIEDKKPYHYELKEADWEAEARFEPVFHRVDEQITQDLMDVKIELTLYHLDKVQTIQPEIRLCLKKEERLHVETPQT